MRLVFMGTPAPAATSLDRLIRDGHEIAAVYTQPDRPSGRGGRVVYSPVKALSLKNGLELRQPSKIRNQDAVDDFRRLGADVTVVVAYGRILPSGFLNAFPFGALNVHFSLLPKYRGAAPVNWAIVNGETETGVSVIRMDEGLDTGDLLLQETVRIGERETSIELMERLSYLGAEMISGALREIDTLTARPQNNKDASFAPILNKEDGQIDWRLPADEIDRRIRGFQPFPSSYSYCNGIRYTFWVVEPIEIVNAATPGTTIEAAADRFLIGCGSNTLLQVKEIQPEGRSRMPVRDFLNGAKIRVGDVFSSR